MFLLPPDVLKDSTPMWLYHSASGMTRALAYRIVDPLKKVVLYMLPEAIRTRALKMSGFFGAVGNLLCTRPEIGIFAFTLVSIWANGGSEFIWNRCLLGNVHVSDTVKKNLVATQEEVARFERVREMSNNLVVQGSAGSAIPKESHALLTRYAASICSIGEGSLTGPAAYRVLQWAFLSGDSPEASMLGIAP